MTVRRWLGLYLIAAAAFVVIDLVWLLLIANPLYDRLLGDLLAEDPVALAAVAFYLIFVAGVVHLVVVPALAAESARKAVVDGAILGFVAYATWDLTSLAVIEGFPAVLVPIDMAWGAVLAASVSAVTFYAWRRLPHRNRIRAS